MSFLQVTIMRSSTHVLSSRPFKRQSQQTQQGDSAVVFSCFKSSNHPSKRFLLTRVSVGLLWFCSSWSCSAFVILFWLGLESCRHKSCCCIHCLCFAHKAAHDNGQRNVLNNRISLQAEALFSHSCVCLGLLGTLTSI